MYDVHIWYDHMKKSYLCTICQREFTRAHDVKRHQETIHQRNTDEDDNKKHKCQYCGKTYSCYSSWSRHQKTICLPKVQKDSTEPNYQQLVSKIKELETRLEEKNKNDIISDSPLIEARIEAKLEAKLERKLEAKFKQSQTNNVLQIVCVTNNDNYLDMLTDKMGNFNTALDYIKDCALSDVNGDCRLIEKYIWTGI